MKKILIIDVDKATLDTFAKAFKPRADNFEIITADSIKEVAKLIDTLELGMIIIDIKMPEASDFEFLSFMNKKYPDIPVIVMTAFGSTELEAKIILMENCQYFDKSVNINDLVTKLFEYLDSSVGGQVHGINLASFLQMSELEKTTCKLKIKSENKIGYLYLTKGNLIAAETGNLDKEEAAYEIISWDNTVIEIESGRVKRKKEIQKPMLDILMESLKIKGERESEPSLEMMQSESRQSLKISSASDLVKTDSMPAKKKPAPPPQKTEPKKTKQAAHVDQAVMGYEKILMKEAKGRKKKRLVISAVAGVASVLIISACAFIWIHFIKPTFLKNEYERVMVKAEIQEELEEMIYVLQNYIHSHDQSPYKINAENKIKDIKKIIKDRDFDETIRNVELLPKDANFEIEAKTLYSAYLSKYPDSSHHEEIKTKIAGLPHVIDNIDYEIAKSLAKDDYEGKVDAYTTYLSKHPDGRHRDAIKNLMAGIGEDYFAHIKKEIKECDNQKIWDQCIELCNHFQKTLSTSTRINEIKQLRNQMKGKQNFIILTERVAKTGTDYKAAKKIYTEYLAINPDSSLKNKIETEIRKIDRKIQNKNEWNAVVAYCQNKQNDIFKRVLKMEDYISDNASEPYADKAKTIMKGLNKEKQDEIRRLQIAKENKLKEEQRLAAIQKEKQRIQNETNKISSLLKRTGGRYIDNGDGTVTDNKTGLVWSILSSQVELKKCLDYKSAKQYVENLTTGGFNDWRLPSEYELVIIYKNKPFFPSSGAAWCWTSEIFTQGWNEKVKVVTTENKIGWERVNMNPEKCGTVQAVRP